jgi:hypothetical protein
VGLGVAVGLDVGLVAPSVSVAVWVGAPGTVAVTVNFPVTPVTGSRKPTTKLPDPSVCDDWFAVNVLPSL